MHLPLNVKFDNNLRNTLNMTAERITMYRKGW